MGVPDIDCYGYGILSPEDDEVLPTSSSALLLIIHEFVLMHVNLVGFLPLQSSPSNVCCRIQYVFGPGRLWCR